MLIESSCSHCLFLAIDVSVPSGAEDLNPLMLYFAAHSKPGRALGFRAWVAKGLQFWFPWARSACGPTV